MISQAWRYYAAAQALAVAAFFLCPTTGVVPVVWQVAIGWAGAAAIVVGIRLHHPPAAAAWYLFATGILLNSSGIAVEAVLTRGGRELGAPSIVDAFYLALYPSVIAGLVVVIARRSGRRQRASLVDALMISTGLGLLVWVMVIHPSLGDPAYTPLGQIVVVAYPIGDFVILALITRLLVGSGPRGFASRALAATVLLFLTGDLTWAFINQFGATPGPHASALLSMIFLAGFAMFGVAALHPSVSAVAAPEAERRSRLSGTMIVVLTTASMIAPGMLVVEAVRHAVEDGIAIALGSMALFLLAIVRMAQLFGEVDSQAEALRRLTQVDDLTGLPNRRAWSLALPAAMERARRTAAALCVVMIDLDHFKRFNDEHGHPAGDRLLKAASAAWLDALRVNDLLARYGGEEFTLLLPDSDGAAALEVVGRLRTATPMTQTFSAGIACWDGVENPPDLLARADDALYVAKRRGRNCAALAPYSAGDDLSSADVSLTVS